jgi:putative endonuclease
MACSERSSVLIDKITMKKNYWVYILLCNNQSYYTGYTHDMPKRYRAHVEGKGRCKYTRSFKPLTIAQCWKISGDKSIALKLEHSIKKLSRPEKEKIIKRPSLITNENIKSISKNLRLKFINVI